MVKKSRTTHYLFLFLVVVIGLFLRVFRIDIAPIAALPDEIDYALSAKSVAYYGSDLTLTQSIWQLTPFITETAMAELGPLFQIPAMIFLPTNMLSVKIMPIVLSMLFILGAYALVLSLFQHSELALLTAALIALNPWAIFIGRTGYEAPAALTFYTWSFVFVSHLSWYFSSTTKRKLVFSQVVLCLGWFLTFSLAFFTYHGTKIPGVGLTLLLIGYLLIKRKQFSNYLLYLLAAICIGIFAINARSLVSNQVRTSEIFLLNKQFMDYYTIESNKQRRIHLAPNSYVTKVFTNSRVFLSQDLVGKVLSSYDPKQLFFSGVSAWSSGLNNFGQFHAFELLFLAFGLYALVRTQKKLEIAFLLFALLVAVSTHILKAGESYFVLQSSFMILLFAVLMAKGFLYGYQRLSSKRKKWFVATVGCMYIFSLAAFGHNYYYRFPLYSEEQFNFKDRLLSKYLASLDTQVAVVITPTPYQAFRNYLFYNELYTRENAETLSPLLSDLQQDKVFDSITFSSNCELILEANNEVAVILSNMMGAGCEDEIQLLQLRAADDFEFSHDEVQIVAVKDSGTHYRIFNDKVCKQVDLPSYSFVQNRSDLQIESLSQEQFCRTWIVQFDR